MDFDRRWYGRHRRFAGISTFSERQNRPPLQTVTMKSVDLTYLIKGVSRVLQLTPSFTIPLTTAKIIAPMSLRSQELNAHRAALFIAELVSGKSHHENHCANLA